MLTLAVFAAESSPSFQVWDDGLSSANKNPLRPVLHRPIPWGQLGKVLLGNAAGKVGFGAWETPGQQHPGAACGSPILGVNVTNWEL